MVNSNLTDDQADADRIHVVAGVLRDADQRILLTERIGDAAFAGLWEFPGGKVDVGESMPAALQRELHEELGINISSISHFIKIEHDYADRRVSIDFFLVDNWHGKPAGQQGQKLTWLSKDQLDASLLMPADGPVVDALKL